MSHFNIDFRKLAVMLLPSFLRGKRLVSLCQVFIQPLVTLNDIRMMSRDDMLFELKHNGQVCYLRDALNKIFGITDSSTGFFISDSKSEGEYIIAYDETPLLQSRLEIVFDEPGHCAIAWSESSINNTNSFVVQCPHEIYDDNNRMAIVRKVVNKYRLASRMPEYSRKTQQL